MNSIIIDGMAFSLPLFIIAIGGIYSEGSGITNLALEGFLGFGAFCGGLAVALFGGSMPQGTSMYLAFAMAALG